MEALKLAFETIIVGALALPWCAVALDLFFSTIVPDLAHLVSLVRQEIQRAVAGVVVLAMTFLIGAAVSRSAGDFFNDAEIGVMPTEDRIRADVYAEEAQFVPAKTFSNPPFIDSTNTRDLKRIFRAQESALFLEGGDRIERLNRLHEQTMVLQGAAFDGLILSLLCLFGRCANLYHSTKRLRLVWWLLPLGVVAIACLCLYYHFCHWSFTEPPFMEAALLVLGLAGCYALWKGAPQRAFGAGLLLSSLATILTFFAWWLTVVLYDQQVIYSFYVRRSNLLHTAF